MPIRLYVMEMTMVHLSPSRDTAVPFQVCYCSLFTKGYILGAVYRMTITNVDNSCCLDIDCHRVSSSQFDFSSLFLTSSADWSVRLWNAADASPNGGNSALHTFLHGVDYVWGVQWSPAHPAVFASIDGGGSLYIWNINQEIEVLRYTLNSVPYHSRCRL